MYVINKLISQDQKEMKELQALPFKKEKVFQISLKKVGLTLSDIFIQNKSNILGGVWEQEEEQKTLVGDLITLLSIKNLLNLSKTP